MLPFDFFFVLFFVAFILILISVLTTFLRTFRRPRGTGSTKGAPVIKEREIIREIVKIRCPYCNNLYDEKYDKCPTAEAKEHPEKTLGKP